MLVRLLPLITVGYACVLVIATHLPPSNAVVVAAAKAPDKFWHFFAYALLGFLTYASDTVLRPRAAYRFLLLGAGLILFAICDELTQPIFGRGTDLWDFIYDLRGILTGFAAAYCLPRILKRLVWRPQSTSADG